MFNHDEMYRSNNSQFLYFSSCEDFNGNLDTFIKETFDWEDKVVLEAGIGMGRITDKYIDKAKQLVVTDKSEIMLEYCKNKFIEQSNKFTFMQCEHERLLRTFGDRAFDTFISSYSLSYAAIKYNGDRLEKVLNDIFSINADKFIITESVGIFSRNDKHFIPYQEYFNYLYKHFDFCHINTDFVFANNEEAVYYSKIFFGEETSDIIRNSGVSRVPEITCVWYNK